MVVTYGPVPPWGGLRLDWDASVRADEVEHGPSGSAASGRMMRRAWSHVVDSHTAITMRDYARTHACLRDALSDAAEAYAEANGYVRGRLWSDGTCVAVCAAGGGELAGTVFARVTDLGDTVHGGAGNGPHADALAHECIDGVAALIALMESRLL